MPHVIIRTSIFLYLLIPFIPLHAQDAINIDSLTKELTRQNQDTNRVNTLTLLCVNLIQTGNFIDAVPYAEEALSLAKSLSYLNGLQDANSILGQLSYRQGKYEEASNYLLANLKIAEDLNQQEEVARIYNNLSLLTMNQGKYEEALHYAQVCLNISTASGNKSIMASAYNNLGLIYMDRGENAAAMKNYNSALTLRKEVGINRWIADSYHNIGLTYENMGDLTLALQNLLVAHKLYEQAGDSNAIAESYHDIGNIYFGKGNLNEALENYQLALDVFIRNNDLFRISGAYVNIATVFKLQGRYTEAEELYLKGLLIKDEIGDQTGSCGVNIELGDLYYVQNMSIKAASYLSKALKACEEIGEHSNITLALLKLGRIYLEMDSLLTARTYLDRALQIALMNNSKTQIGEAYADLVTLEEKSANPAEALRYYKLYFNIEDSLRNDHNSQLMAELQTQHETEKKDKEILKLENEKQLSGLQLKMQQESFHRVKLEKDNLATTNLLNLQHIELLDKEKTLRQTELEMKNSELATEKAISEAQRSAMMLMEKEAEIQKLKLNKQTAFKNYLLGGSLLLCILGIFIYSNYIARQKLKLQTLRIKIASDLHDDIGSTLSSISIFSEMAQKQSKEVIPLLNTIGESSRKMLDAMADIVWSINPENDQFENLLLRMRSFAYQLLGSRKIQFEFEADDIINKRKLSMDIRKNLYLIFKEAANNMAKYSEAKQAYFSIREENNTLVMLIRDNGKGFDSQSPSNGNGLKNMKRRAEEMGGQLSIDSSLGSGTSIFLRIAI